MTLRKTRGTWSTTCGPPPLAQTLPQKASRTMMRSSLSSPPRPRVSQTRRQRRSTTWGETTMMMRNSSPTAAAKAAWSYGRSKKPRVSYVMSEPPVSLPRNACRPSNSSSKTRVRPSPPPRPAAGERYGGRHRPNLHIGHHPPVRCLSSGHRLRRHRRRRCRRRRRGRAG